MPIRVLDAATVGRIAAGEVVERPSSVVKELMENSIDAGATAITVEIKGGGIDYLRVTDNGCGIEPEQVRMAFENHATSKLQNAEQLDDIRTLGFRGEALPSIAAVSHVEMTTRAKGRDAGVKLNIDGGQDIRAKEAGCPEGTTFIMKDLFYNVPVRRAFLKKPGYEGGLVSDAVARMILGNPGVSVRFINNGTTSFHSFGDGKLRHAVFAVYGKAAAEQMIELDACEGGVRIRGLIGVGEIAKPTRAHQAFFINGRYVRCAVLTKALETVCRTRVTVGMYPMCALHVTLPATGVDVNVHPNKLEVRFRDEAMMRQTAEALMTRAFTGEHMLRFDPESAPRTIERVATVTRIDTPVTPAPQQSLESVTKQTEVEEKPTKLNKEQTMVGNGTAPAPKPEEGYLQRVKAYREAVDRAMGEVPAAKPATELREDVSAGYIPHPHVAKQATDEQVTIKQIAPPSNKPEYRVIGVLLKTYILIEANDSLMMIDQHAAHERLNYEKLMAALETGTGSQQLLTPLIVHLTGREMALIRENIDVLSEAGYTVEPFGETDIQVRAVPFILGKAEQKPAFMEIVGALNRTKLQTVDLRRAEIMQMSCKSAVKGGDRLSDAEVESLIRQMLESGAPPTCPHGRPVMKQITRRELEKLFKRIQ